MHKGVKIDDNIILIMIFVFYFVNLLVLLQSLVNPLKILLWGVVIRNALHKKRTVCANYIKDVGNHMNHTRNQTLESEIFWNTLTVFLNQDLNVSNQYGGICSFELTVGLYNKA